MKEVIQSFVSERHQPFFVWMSGISYCDGSYRIERNNCPFYALEYIVEGEGTLIINENQFTPSEGDVYILDQESNHIYYSSTDKPWTKIWFAVSGKVAEALMQAFSLKQVYHLEKCDVRLFFDRFIDLTHYKFCSSEEMNRNASIIFHELLIAISQERNTDHLQYSPLVFKLKQYIDCHLESKLSIQELSSHVFKSPSQIIRCFKKETGLTPYDYLMQKRLESAKLLLLNTNISIKEIAYKLHFFDEHYFSNYFKSNVRLSPTEFRKQNTYS